MAVADTKLTLVDRMLLYLSANRINMRVKSKRGSFFMTILGKVLFFNKSFMRRYYTTIGDTVYTPLTGYEPDSKHCLTTIAHEVMHIRQSKNYPTMYALVYLFPQCLALLSLLAFVSSPWFLLTLLFLLPWPAPGRIILERQAYLMTLAMGEWLTGQTSEYEIEFVLDQFTGSAYYWMKRGGKEDLRKWFESNLGRIRVLVYPSSIFETVFEFLREEKLVHPTFLGRIK